MAGETSLEAARRELSEETGIEAPAEAFRFLNTIATPRIFSDIYLVRLCDFPPIHLQSTETVDYLWVTPNEMLERCRKGLVIPHLAERFPGYAAYLNSLIQKEDLQNG